MLAYLSFTLCNCSAKKVNDQLYTRRLLNLKDMIDFASSLFTAKREYIQKLHSISKKALNNTLTFRENSKKPVGTKRRAKEILEDGWNTYNISMEEIVRNRLKELRSLLQDDNAISFSEDRMDTIIVEFRPLKEAINDSAKELHERLGNLDPNLKAIENTDECPSFVVCSEDLQNFLLDFYKSLLETTNAALQPYAAMYSGYVSPKGDVGKQVVEEVKMAKIAIKSEIAKIYEKAVNSFQLSKNKNRNENTGIIKEFILETIKQVKEAIPETIKKVKSSRLRASLQHKIANDVYMSVGSQLDSVGNLLKKDICTIFYSCISRISTKRTMDEEKEGVYVIFAPSNGTDVPMRSVEDSERLYTINLDDYTNVIVTRTSKNPNGSVRRRTTKPNRSITPNLKCSAESASC
ncbi:uncharacterized protein LOC119693457 [Plutella xylostella]|uniref:uncharacterized protein LOC119693457 n=1 Tax=Plutella xylostella TaxID=51655 RepID=UPI00203279EA|nr:uncharacterized protein LOC119693457 [Plutella xylostella]